MKSGPHADLRVEKMDELMERVAEWIGSKEGRLLIGVSGHGGAGKTTFTQRLVKRLGDQKVNCLNTDPYIVSSSIRKSALIDYTYDGVNHRYKMTACHPEAHHLGALERDVRMVREGLDFYTIDVHYLERQLITSGKRVTIVEGMSTAFIDPELFDLKIYFYTDGDTEFARRSSRDIAERGMDPAYLKASHNERRIQYELFMHPYSRNFDIVIKSEGERQVVEKMAFGLGEYAEKNECFLEENG